MNERAALCVGSWQVATSFGIIEIIDDTEHSYALSLHSWFNTERNAVWRGKVLYETIKLMEILVRGESLYVPSNR